MTQQTLPALPHGSRIVIGAFAASGVVHLVKPEVFAPLIPRQLGDPRPWVYGSGVVELVCAAGLATRQPWAPLATAATLGAIWVGNVEMALRFQRSERVSTAAKAAAWARLPLQIPLIAWAWRSPTTRRALADVAER